MNPLNTLLSDPSLTQFSFDEIGLSWLLATAAFVTVFSLVLAWLGTFIIYVKSDFLKRVFPATHNLIRSHIDYLMMASLLGVIYMACVFLNVALPKAIIAILCFGALYNPFGFIIKAINPKAGHSDTFMGKLGVCLGFVPATIGFGYSMSAVLAALVA